jgi:hypothetical protein
MADGYDVVEASIATLAADMAAGRVTLERCGDAKARRPPRYLATLEDHAAFEPARECVDAA